MSRVTCGRGYWLGPSMTVIRNVTYASSGFVDDVRIKDEYTYVSSSSPDGGTSRTSDNVSWSRIASC